MMITSAVALLGCADPCADLPSPPTLTLGGANADGTTFEAYSSGDERDLIFGPQGGMHVWLHLRVSGLCTTQLVLEREVTDSTGTVLDLGRGVPSLVETEEADVLQLLDPAPMIVCPPTNGVSPVGQILTARVTATDIDGREASDSLDFVPRCAAGDDCSFYCDPP